MLTIERLQCQHPQRNYRKPKRPWWLKQDGQEEEEQRVTPPWSSAPQSQGWWRMRRLLCQCSTFPTLHGFSHISEPRAWLLFSIPTSVIHLPVSHVSVVRAHGTMKSSRALRPFRTRCGGRDKVWLHYPPSKNKHQKTSKYFCSGRSSLWGLWPTPLCGKGKAVREVKRKGERKDEKRK